MIVLEDNEYSARYPERPKRFVVTDDGPYPTYVTADVIPVQVAKAEADLAKWNEIEAAVAALG